MKSGTAEQAYGFFCALCASGGEIDLVNVNDKRVLIVGLGKSGVALSALFLEGERRARSRFLTLSQKTNWKDEIPVLLDHGVAVETGGHGERTFGGQDLIVVSPGVPYRRAFAGGGAVPSAKT